MIERLDITGVHFEISDDLRRYVQRKIGKLDRYVRRRHRESLHVEVRLIESSVRSKKNCTCEVVMHLPGESIIVKETTLNMFAAVDIVEAKLKNQLKAYKDKHNPAKFRRKILAGLRRRST